MSAEIVNLRQVRKQKARAVAEEKAAINRVSFGLSKIERNAAELAKQTAARKLDGHRLKPPKPDDG